MATAVAGELLSRLADAQASGHEPQIALTGGSIAEAVHREIARLSPGSEVDWTRVGVWWGDERFVEPGSEDRNARGARAAFLDAVGATAGARDALHRRRARRRRPARRRTPTACASTAAASFDVVMLGVGPDGHVASLFPGHPQLDSDDVAVAVTDSPKPPPERISLTFAALNRSRSVWLLVSGDGKAEAVAAALAAEGDVRTTPARGVRGQEDTVWFLDRAAASRL